MPPPPVCSDPADFLRSWSLSAADIARTLRELTADRPRPGSSRLTHQSLLAQDVDVIPLGDQVFLTPHRETAASRAILTGIALAPLEVSNETVIADESAAWVWCGGAPPPRIVVTSPDRLRPPPFVRARQVTLQPHDVQVVGGCPVMSPTRAFAELASRTTNPLGSHYARAMLEAGWISPEELRRRGRLERRAERAGEAAADCGGGATPTPPHWRASRYYALARAAQHLLAAPERPEAPDRSR